MKETINKVIAAKKLVKLADKYIDSKTLEFKATLSDKQKMKAVNAWKEISYFTQSQDPAQKTLIIQAIAGKMVENLIKGKAVPCPGVFIHSVLAYEINYIAENDYPIEYLEVFGEVVVKTVNAWSEMEPFVYECAEMLANQLNA